MILIGLLIIAGIAYYLYKTNQGNLVSSKNAHIIGAAGENEIAHILRNLGINGHLFNNLYIQFHTGKSTEIDLVFLTDRKIYVIESKNYNGKIYGNIFDKNWRVQYRNGKTYTLYNPIMQNKTHVNAISNHLIIPENLLESVVVFGDGAELGDMCENCINTRNLADYIIKSYKKSGTRLTEQEINTISQQLGSLTGAGYITKMKHINQIKRDHGR